MIVQTISVYNCLKSLLLLAMCYHLTSCDIPSPKNEQPNVILFLIDDYGYGDISFEGNTQIQTPNIDRIAQQGARFNRFYQSSGACAPTRASLLTGRYHLETGVWGVHYGRDYLHRDETTLGDIFRNANYATGAFGKWHSGKTWSYYGWNRGFDVAVHSKLYQYFNTQVLYNNKLVNISGPVTDVIGDQVVRFIEQNRDRPFFCYVPFQSIHEPFNCPPDIFQKYKSEGYSDHVARLYGMIEVLDNNIGKIINKTQELDLLENTVVLFLCDDGPSPGCDLSYSVRRMNQLEKEEREKGWARKLRGGKANIWEGGSITPFYIMWKDKIKAGRSYDPLAGVIDILPSLADICNIEIPSNHLPLAGRSFWPILQGETPADWKNRMYFDNSNFYQIPKEKINLSQPEMHHISVHFQNYKYVRSDHSLYGKEEIEHYLFDLKQDPVEEINIIDQHAELRSKLESAVNEWYRNVLRSGRAFQEAVFEIGHWEAGASAIHLDAVTKLTGTVKRSNQSGFHFDGWTPGSSMSFNTDVVEAGEYFVELIYLAEPEDFGSKFKVYGNTDTASIIINNRRNAFSDTLHLNEGRQLLTIELSQFGKTLNALDRMRHLIVHRIPGPEDIHLSDKGFHLTCNGNSSNVYYYSPAVADFMTANTDQYEPFEIKKGQTVLIQPVADFPEELIQTELFLDFRSVDVHQKVSETFQITPDFSGSYTINLEFTFRNGKKISTYGVLEVI